ncbi:MAG: hypothetical protein HC913_11865 [Microscillaceae bacterium]|nr:hypothetical protein [Microscillaceae bacterium]
MNIHTVKQNQWLIFETISGSRAYGLATPHSDTDIRGVFIAPPEVYYRFNPPLQVNDERQNTVYYELKKFIELLGQNNPTMLELLFMPKEFIIASHPVFTQIQAFPILSKLCAQTFGQYALSQIRKARGLHKKVFNPIPDARKGILDFCYILQGASSVPLLTWLSSSPIQVSACGLAQVPHFKNVYALFYDAEGQKGYRGLLDSENAQALCLSAIPKGEKPLGAPVFPSGGLFALLQAISGIPPMGAGAQPRPLCPDACPGTRLRCQKYDAYL